MIIGRLRVANDNSRLGEGLLVVSPRIVELSKLFVAQGANVVVGHVYFLLLGLEVANYSIDFF